MLGEYFPCFVSEVELIEIHKSSIVLMQILRMKPDFHLFASLFKLGVSSKYKFHGAARNPRQLLAMMYIPKTAGTSVMHDISMALVPKLEVRGFDRTLFGTFDDFEKINERGNVVYLEATDMPANADLVMGHFSYHTLKARYPYGQQITFLREPFTRLLSLWIFWRCQTDEALAGWGKWEDFVKISRLSLKEFLSDTRIASQTDNMALRMLLWPSTDTPPDQFIDVRLDHSVLRQAFERLDSFSYSDVIENPSFSRQLKSWLQMDMASSRLNETAKVPEYLRLNLEGELDEETFELSQRRSRLDLKLWSALAGRRLTDGDIEALRSRTILGGVARYSRLLSPA